MVKALEVRGLIRTYPEFTLGPLDLDLEPGIAMGYVGPNGSGKTTTLHALTGLVRKNAGEVRIFGQPNEPNNVDWKRDIGYVGDKHVFYENWTAEQNLNFRSRFYPTWSDSLVAELVDRLGLPLAKKAKELSSGNRTKLTLVSALGYSPKLLMLDEPTSGLDPVVRTEVLDVLFEAIETGERSILYSTHILSDIGRLADELTFLSEGKPVEQATIQDLTDRWRRISFRLDECPSALEAAVNCQADGDRHLAVSSDGQTTLQHLGELGAANTQEARMSVEEIAVQIMKGARNVEDD